MSIIDTTVVIADDLTGANDTALQFFNYGLSAKIIIDFKQDFSNSENTDVWAASTESRNIDKQTALDRVTKVCEILLQNINTENFYKKIDSTLRGNVGVEIIALLESLGKDAAIIAPAYIDENRTTIGSFQLISGVPIERSQCALDPKAPVVDSYIPDILAKDINPQIAELIDTIDLRTVVKGAGPITIKLKELIQKGKKLIIIDAMSNVDLEQIALAIDKSGQNILPVGSAGLANAINKIHDHGSLDQKSNSIEIPKLPRLIVSGSATILTQNQIETLRQNNPQIVFVDLTIEDIVKGSNSEMIEKIVSALRENKDVVVHSSNINKEFLDDEALNILIDLGIPKVEFPSRITDFLSALTYEVNLRIGFILIILGGETSYKCAYKINSGYLEIIDAIMPAIPLCRDKNNKIIVTKSGNFGDLNTLIDIIDYFNKL